MSEIFSSVWRLLWLMFWLIIFSHYSDGLFKQFTISLDSIEQSFSKTMISFAMLMFIVLTSFKHLINRDLWAKQSKSLFIIAPGSFKISIFIKTIKQSEIVYSIFPSKKFKSSDHRNFLGKSAIMFADSILKPRSNKASIKFDLFSPKGIISGTRVGLYFKAKTMKPTPTSLSISFIC